MANVGQIILPGSAVQTPYTPGNQSFVVRKMRVCSAPAIGAPIAGLQGVNPALAQPLTIPGAWAATTAYSKGMSVTNSGNVYACIVAGTSAGSGGPTLTTNGAIVDGTVNWYFMGAVYSSNATAPTYTITNPAGAYAGNFWSNTANNNILGAAQIRDTSNFRVTGTPFTETGAAGGNANAIVGSTSAVLTTVSFMTDALAFQVVAQGGTTLNSQIYINGVPLTMAFGSQTNPGSALFLHQLVFATRQPRLVTYETFAGVSPFSFLGCITQDLISKVWYPVVNSSFRMAIVGSSYIAGSLQHPVTQSLGWGALTGKLLNCTDCYQDALGSGTGYLAGTTYSTPSRFYPMVNYNPDIVVVAGGGINDRNVAGVTIALEQQAVLQYLQLVRASLPTAIIIVIGSESGATGPATNVFQMELAASQAVLQFQDPNTFFIPQSYTVAEKAWMSGTGTTAAPNTTGNSDQYIGTDGIHPVQAGVNYIAQQSANGILSVLNSMTI